MLLDSFVYSRIQSQMEFNIFFVILQKSICQIDKIEKFFFHGYEP